MVKKLYFIENEDELDPFKTLSEAIENFDNFMDFVIQKEEIQSLTKDPEAEEDKQWKIGAVPIDEIAQAFKAKEEGEAE